MDYTPEGIRYLHSERILSQLDTVNKSLKKINKKLTVVAVAGLAYVVLKRKDIITNIKNMKGE